MKITISAIIISLFLNLTAWALPPLPLSLFRDSNCNQVQYQRFGILCQDTDDGKLYKWTGTALKEVMSYDINPGTAGNVMCTTDGTNWSSCVGSANTVYGTSPAGVSGWYGNWSFDDSAPVFFNQSDTTKKLQFNLAGITTNTVRTITVPDSDIVLGTGSGETVSVITGDTTLASNNTYLVNGSATVSLYLPAPTSGGGPITVRNTNAEEIEFFPSSASVQIETAPGTLNTASYKVHCTSGDDCSTRLYSVTNKWLMAYATGTWADGGEYDFSAPTLTSATIPAAGTSISLLFSEAITIGAGGNGGWTLTVTPSATMAYASGDTTDTLVYDLNRTVSSGESLTINYTQPGSGMEDGTGNDLAGISAGEVTNSSTYVACTGFVVCQNFETATTGYDNSESWTQSVPTGATVSPVDTTATILRGTQQLKMVGGTAAGASTMTVFASAYGEVWGHCLFKAPDASPGSTSNIFTFRTSGGSNAALAILRSDGKLRAQYGAISTDTVSTLSDNTAYRIWVHYKKATGVGANDGIMEVEFTDAATASPTWTGDAYAIVNTGTGTSNVQQAFVATGINQTHYWDQILVDDAAITGVPE